MQIHSACATFGVMATPRLAARICREAGARVARNIRLADMNVDVPVADARRIEVVANGLPLWHGSQLALDATIVSPLTRLGEAHLPMSSPAALSMLQRAASDIKPTRSSSARRCRLVVVGIEVGGRFGTETVQLLRMLARHRAESVPAPGPSRPAAITAWVARCGPHSWPSQPSACWQPLCWSLEMPPVEGLGDGPVPDLHEVLADARSD